MEELIKDVRFPDDDGNHTPKIEFQIWEEDANPYLATKVNISRCAGSIMIEFLGDLNKHKGCWATVGISAGDIVFKYYRGNEMIYELELEHND